MHWITSSDGYTEDEWKSVCYQILLYTSQTHSLWRMHSARGDANGWRWIGFTNSIQPLGYGITQGKEGIRAMFSLIRGKPDIALQRGMTEMAVTVSAFQSCLIVRLPHDTFNPEVVLPLSDIQRFNTWFRFVASIAPFVMDRMGHEYGIVLDGYAVSYDGIFESMADGKGWQEYSAMLYRLHGGR